MLDVLVAGGGPAGSRTAALLARDRDVLVLEEHPESGLPVQCAGLITEDVIQLSGVRPDIISRIRGAEVVMPDGTSVSVRSDSVKAVTIDRHQFDSRLADAALAAGAGFSYGERCRGYRIAFGHVEASTSSGARSARLIVGADGHSSVVARDMGRGPPREYLRGIQAVVDKRMEHDDMFRARLGSESAPGFFSWEIPCGDLTRVGLCTSWEAGPPMPYLRNLLRRIGAEDRVVSMQSGKIPMAKRVPVSAERCMLVGDAACQVKPVSGGGLYPGLTAAGILAEVTSEALSRDDLSSKRLSRYDSGCSDAFGDEIRKGYMLRGMLLRMSDDDLNDAGRYANRDDVRTILDGIEIDHPSRVVPAMLRRPRAALAAIPLLMRCIF